MYKYLPTNLSAKKPLILGLLACLIYVLINFILTGVIGSAWINYLIKPSMWLSLAGIICYLPKVRTKSPLKCQGAIYWWAFTFALIYLVVSILAGFVDGLGKSPYDQTPKGILMNLFVVGSFILAIEVLRSYLVNSLTSKKENYLLFVLIALFTVFLGTSLEQIINLKDNAEIVKYLARFLAPDFARHLFATYLAFLGGPGASLIYMGLLEGFHWFSPVLPNLKWITTALIGVLIPVFSLSLMQMFYLTEAKLLKNSDWEHEGPLGWILTSILSIMLVWFAVGVFPIYPSVIATGSMEPMIKPGDVILVNRIAYIEDIINLQVGDVIQFERGGILISHRVHEICLEGNVRLFYTKGDNNSAIDYEPVRPEQLRGKICKVVPKIGWPTLLIKSNKSIDNEGRIF